jgi:regulator of protease activity HflC (stomatin/prohibitin superfamily)
MNSNELGMNAPKRMGWAISSVVFVLLAVSFLFGSFYVVDTGHVGVERTLGKVDLVESEPGMNFKLPC